MFYKRINAKLIIGAKTQAALDRRVKAYFKNN